MDKKFLGMPAISENYFGKKYRHNVHFNKTDVGEHIGNWLEQGPAGKWGWYYERKELERGIAPADQVVLSFEKGEDALICEMKK